MPQLQAVDIFTPNAFPTHTYVKRDEDRLEKRLRQALATPGEVVSISGPSKSGKTVLIERVVGVDNLITITGAGLSKPEAIWDRILDSLSAPVTTSNMVTWQTSGGVSGGGGGGISIPGVAEAKATAQGTVGIARTSTTSQTAGRTSMNQVVDELAGSSRILLIDDFHYMSRDIQIEVAKQIKEAARQGVKICTASVPHRSDDVVRANPELRGRLRIVNLAYWKPAELAQIAKLGFPKLNIIASEILVDRFSTEASGSPQLMQALCLQTCFELGAEVELNEPTSFALPEERIVSIFQETASRTDFSSLLRLLHGGPKIRGTERKTFHFSDDTRGDVYRCLLIAMATSPPRLSFNYNELSRRIDMACRAGSPNTQSIYQALQQMASIAQDMSPNERVLDWDEDHHLLDIGDPYFLYYLRWSDALTELGAP
jgi:hypothetical protein